MLENLIGGALQELPAEENGAPNVLAVLPMVPGGGKEAATGLLHETLFARRINHYVSDCCEAGRPLLMFLSHANSRLNTKQGDSPCVKKNRHDRRLRKTAVQYNISSCEVEEKLMIFSSRGAHQNVSVYVCTLFGTCANPRYGSHRARQLTPLHYNVGHRRRARRFPICIDLTPPHERSPFLCVPSLSPRRCGSFIMAPQNCVREAAP